GARLYFTHWSAYRWIVKCQLIAELGLLTILHLHPCDNREYPPTRSQGETCSLCRGSSVPGWEKLDAVSILQNRSDPIVRPEPPPKLPTATSLRLRIFPTAES